MWARSLLPLKAGDPVELIFPKGFELIRVDTADNWELVIGDYIPREPPPGGPVYQVPQSGWPAGLRQPVQLLLLVPAGA